MNTNEKLIALTANMPCKQINLPKPMYQWDEKIRNDTPYIQRYYAGTFRDNKDLWLHRFLSGDSERHLHSHPFNFSTIIVNGGYSEEKICRATKEKVIEHYGVLNFEYDEFETVVKSMNHGIEEARPWSDHFNFPCRQIDVFDWHRIYSVQPETWTALIVDSDRLPFWFFVNDAGAFEPRESSSRDWWKKYGKRGDNAGDMV